VKSSSIKKNSHASNHHAMNTTAAPPAVAASTPVSSTFAARVQHAAALINEAVTVLNLGETALSPEDKRRSLKLKKGGEVIVPQLAVLSARYGVEVPSRPTEAMTASLQLAEELEPLRATIAEISSIVEGAYASSRSETWKTATSLYSMLKKGSVREPMLGAALQPLQAYFANRHPSVKAAHAQVPAANAVDQAQLRAQKRIAKLQQELARLHGALPAPQAAAPVMVPTTASTSEASLANGAAHVIN